MSTPPAPKFGWATPRSLNSDGVGYAEPKVEVRFKVERVLLVVIVCFLCIFAIFRIASKSLSCFLLKLLLVSDRNF